MIKAWSKGVFAVVCIGSTVAASVIACGGDKSAPPAAPGVSAPAAPAAPAAPGAAAPTTGGSKTAKATISTTSDGGITGTATLTSAGGKVDIALELDKAPPGQHAWHIHEGTSCDREKQADGGMGAPGSAAGPHWNPGKTNHGLPTAKSHHAGDFGNFTVEASGKGSAKISTSDFSLDEGAPNNALGHALIIHGGVDDGQGTNGDAGARIGCGIIK